MHFRFSLALCLFFSSFLVQSQEINTSNTDVILEKAIELYRNKEYSASLVYTQRGLELAPEYHDIRLFQIRNNLALNNFDSIDEDLIYLSKNAPEYPGVKNLVYRSVNLLNSESRIAAIKTYQEYFPDDLHLEVLLASAFLDNGQKEESRAIAQSIFGNRNLSDGDKYLLQNVMKRTVTDIVAVNYQIISFKKDYPRKNPWHNISAEYQHNINKTAVIGRVNYSDRSYTQGYLLELETYPVFNERMYGFINLGYSQDEIFPEFSTSASIFYNFAERFEAEAGTRILHYNQSSYFTGILGLSIYINQFYINTRGFIGPERIGALVQNYQLNLRYFLNNPDNYLLFTVGSGISPDERNLYTQVQNNPNLQAYYSNLGIRKSFNFHHIVQLTAGFLMEDISNNRNGRQFIGNIHYRYRF